MQQMLPLLAVFPDAEQGPVTGVGYLQVNVGMTLRSQPNLEFDYSGCTTTEIIGAATLRLRLGLCSHVGDQPRSDVDGFCDRVVPDEDQTINHTMVHDSDGHAH